MEVQGLPEALILIMEQRGWSQTDLARELGVSQGWVSLASRGERDPGITRTSGYLARVGWELRLRPKAKGGPVKRRRFMGLVGATSVALVPESRVGAYQDPVFVRALAQRLDSGLYEYGGAPIVSEALRHASHLKQAINSSDRVLQSAASELMCRAADVLYNMQRFTAAKEVGGLALVLADHGGDLNAKARVYGILSQISNGHSDRARAAKYARSGLGLHDIGHGERSMLYVRLARSLAPTNGREYETQSALDAAREAGGTSQIDDAIIELNAGIAFHDLRSYKAANESLNEAIELAKSSPLLQAHCLVSQVERSLHTSNPLAAAEYMFGLARVVPIVASVKVDAEVSDVLAASAQWNAVPEVREAREQLQAVARPPTGSGR